MQPVHECTDQQITRSFHRYSYVGGIPQSEPAFGGDAAPMTCHPVRAGLCRERGGVPVGASSGAYSSEGLRGGDDGLTVRK